MKKKVKEKHSKAYKVFRFFFGWIILAYYHPKVENKEYIPKKGPFIMCGNHIHVMDQCIPMLNTKRMVHYMAKKEYFDGKNAWFFKMMGCISVNRQIHDEVAKGEAMDVLNNGFALGIFPEGTRNQVSCKEASVKELYDYYKKDMSKDEFVEILKNNQVRLSQIELLKDLLKQKKITKKFFKKAILDSNHALNELLKDKVITKVEYKNSLMLPTKFGAVSMAQKSGATIVPFVVSGKYKFFKNHLKITFLEPFDVLPDDNLEEKNNHLRDIMIDELYKNNKEV